MSAREIEDRAICKFFASATKGFSNAATGRKTDRKIVEGVARCVHCVAMVDLKGNIFQKDFLFVREIR